MVSGEGTIARGLFGKWLTSRLCCRSRLGGVWRFGLYCGDGWAAAATKSTMGRRATRFLAPDHFLPALTCVGCTGAVLSLGIRSRQNDLWINLRYPHYLRVLEPALRQRAQDRTNGSVVRTTKLLSCSTLSTVPVWRARGAAARSTITVREGLPEPSMRTRRVTASRMDGYPGQVRKYRDIYIDSFLASHRELDDLLPDK